MQLKQSREVEKTDERFTRNYQILTALINYDVLWQF